MKALDLMHNTGVNCITVKENTDNRDNWSHCEACKTFAELYECHGYNPTEKEIYDFELCPDCLDEVSH